MNRTYLPRLLVIPLVIIVVASFFVGTFRAFTPARAGSDATFTPSTSLVSITGTTITPLEPENETLVSTPAFTSTPLAGSNGSYTPNPSTTPKPENSADMTGIIALGILMVFMILVGMAWGEGGLLKKKETKK